MSPIQQARKMIEAHSLAAAFQIATPIIQIQPETADNFDGDEILRDLPDMFSMPHKWIKGKDQVEMRASGARQQQAAGPAMVQGGQGVADVVKTVADAHAATAKGNAGAGVTERKANPSGRSGRSEGSQFGASPSAAQ
jgi:hypothetical protein